MIAKLWLVPFILSVGTVDAQQPSRQTLIRETLANLPKYEEVAWEFWQEDLPQGKKVSFADFYKAINSKEFLLGDFRAVKEVLFGKMFGDVQARWDDYFLKVNVSRERTADLKGLEKKTLSQVTDELLKRKAKVRVEGKTLHFGAVSRAYRYTVDATRETIVVKIRIAFDNFDQLTSERQQLVTTALREAEDRWNEASDQVSFVFDLVRSGEASDFAIRADFSPKGGVSIFDKKFGLGDQDPHVSYETAAHEVGHMLGLVDEYRIVGHVKESLSRFFSKKKTIRLDKRIADILKEFQCPMTSVMCVSPVVYASRPSHEHLKVILARALGD